MDFNLTYLIYGVLGALASGIGYYLWRRNRSKPMAFRGVIIVHTPGGAANEYTRVPYLAWENSQGRTVLSRKFAGTKDLTRVFSLSEVWENRADNEALLKLLASNPPAIAHAIYLTLSQLEKKHGHLAISADMDENQWSRWIGVYHYFWLYHFD